MRKQIFVLTAMVVLISIAATSFTNSVKQDGFKNLKVLPKDISRDSLRAVMSRFNGSLGVKCGFCHAPDTLTGKLNFASDDKPEKEIARAMMNMTTDINKNYFNFNNSAQPDTIQAVTCYTCHNGNPHPEAKLKIAKEGDMPKDHPPVPNGQTPSTPPNGSDKKPQ